MAAILVVRSAGLAGHQLSPIAGVAVLQTRGVHNNVIPTGAHTPRGRGGRSSFSGICATVFGGTGFLGRYVINKLGRDGSQIVVPHRCDWYNTLYLRPMGDLGQIVFSELDERDPESYRKMLKHSNVVINMIGRDWETRNFKFEEVNIDLARTIAQLCKEEGVERLIHVSSLNADPNSPSKLYRTKFEGEEAVKEAFPDATILRPAQMFGREDRFLNYYANLRAFGGVPLISRGRKTIRQPVYVGDVATAIINAAKERDAKGKTFELVGPNRYYLYDMVEYIYRVMHRTPFIYPYPKFLYMLAARFGELKWRPLLTRDQVIRDHHTDETTAGVPGLEDLGVTPTSLEAGAISVLRRHRIHRWYEEAVDDIQPAKTAS
ncbi:NADH dehydrogenase [ubiquinone] 1 alpha subcomplex subunit 9, mitochondrial-like isoform X2 [Branchiostoma floridae x Branchiostoma japonicum]